MKKKVIIGLLTGVLFLHLFLNGCIEMEQNQESINEISEEKTEDIYIEDSVYVPDEEGYFSLIDQGYNTMVKSQIGGTCWVNAASTSMESSYYLLHEDIININAMQILDYVHGNDKQEGYFLKDGVNGQELGGWSWQIIETLSNGFGEYVLVEAVDYSEASVDEIKNAIRTYGGMYVAVNDTSAMGRHNGYMTINEPDLESFDHSVVLVGWDDNFPKEYFSKEASVNGAWLAQNSLSDAWGNDGYYWISYDMAFREQTIFILSEEYSKVLSYDGGKENVIQTGTDTVVGNIFHEPGKLAAVGTYISEEQQDIVIEIYDVETKELIYAKEEHFELPGYYVVPLDEILNVNHYMVVIHYNGAAPVEGESWSDMFIEYRVGAGSDESYVLLDGVWKDMSDSDIKEYLGIDFVPNNCCIKALYVE